MKSFSNKQTITNELIDQLNIQLITKIFTQNNLEQLLCIQYVQKHCNKLPFNKYTIYSQILTHWYQQLLLSNLQYVHKALSQIAFNMCIDQKYYFSLGEVSQQNINLFNNNQNIEIYLLKFQLDRYQFIHKSLVEYYAAQYLIKEVINLTYQFEVNDFLRPTGICNMIIDWYNSNKSSYDILINIVLRSRISKQIKKSAAAAITILNICKVKFSGMDLSGISIPNANLTGGYFQNTLLQDCNLQNVIFHNTHCTRTRFNRSDMRGVSFDTMITKLNYSIRAMDIDKTGKNVVTGGINGSITVHEVKSMKKLGEWNQNSIGIFTIKYSNDGKRIISGSLDKIIRIFDAISGNLMMILRGHLHFVSSLCVSPQGSTFASGSNDSTIKIWNQQTGVSKHKLIGHTKNIHCLAYSSDGLTLVSGSGDNTIRIWNSQTGKCLKILNGHKSIVYSISYSSDNKKIISGGEDNTIRIWTISTGQHQVLETGNIVYCVNYSPDNSKIISSNNDKTIMIWEVQTKQKIKSFDVYNQHTLGLCYFPNEKYIISGSYDGKIKLWNTSWFINEINKTSLQLQIKDLVFQDTIVYDPCWSYLMNRV